MNFLFSSLLLVAGLSLRTSKRILMIIAPENFRDEELLIPKKSFEEKKHVVCLASTKPGTALGKLGARVTATLAIKDIKIDDWDALVLVGGGGCKVYWDDPVLHTAIIEAYKKDKIIAAICSASVILANAGILAGKRATVFPGDSQFLVKKGVAYSLENVVSDGKIITANGPEAAGDFALKILEELQK